MNTEPVVLLPVRIETRSEDQGAVLRVRIYPDDIHVDTLDEGVSEDEQRAGEAYWRAVWSTAGAVTPPPDAWTELVRRTGSRRAAWVAAAMTPGNLDRRATEEPAFPTPPARSNRGAVVRTLPDRFHVLAFQGSDISAQSGAPVSQELAVGLPGASGGGPLELVGGVPVVDPALRWLVDFEEAVRVGMGMRVQLAHPGRRVDRLVVVGVHEHLAPTEAAERLAALLRAHAYTDGAAFVPQGSPTNNTDTDRAAWSREVGAGPPPLDAGSPAPGSNADVLAQALGVPLTTFGGFEHAADLEQPHAEAMTTALWATTWEVLFDKLTSPATPGRAFTQAQRDALREHAIGHLRGRGPLPALRIGRQPYGVLPATNLTPGVYHPLEGGTADDGLASFLTKVRKLWASGVANVPTVMSGDLEAALPEILGTSPVLLGLRVRSLTTVTVCYEPLPGYLGADENCEAQFGIDQIAREFLGVEPTQVGSNGLLGKATRILPLPLVHASDQAYIERLIHSLSGGPPQSVLQALLGLAAANELHEWQKATADEGLDRIRVAVDRLETDVVELGRVTEALAVVGDADADPRHAALVDETAAMLADRVGVLDRGALAAAYPVDALRPQALITAATRGQQSQLADTSVALQIAGELLRVNQRNREFRTALEVLLTVGDEAERALLLAEVLDTASHRLDAWVTSLAARRLAWQRAQGRQGVVLGAYGWVENIDLETPALDDVPEGLQGPVFVSPRDGGYVHAPSLNHAATAGVLRSARLTHDAGDSGSPALDIDLSSTRMRLALHVVDGIRQGQPLGALLGYRLERWLHERSGAGLELDRYIYVLRSLAPLRTGKLTERTPGEVSGSLESVAAANVLDGVRLLELYSSAAGPATIGARLDAGPDEKTYIDAWAPASVAEKQAVLDAIQELERVHDAVADLLLAEAVHQLVQGNTGRAAAALDAAGGGDGPPPQPDVLRTPRSGTAFTHRLLVLAPPPSLDASSGWSDDAPRALAEPRLEAWARAQLGPASGIVVAVDQAEQPELTLADLDLCALDVVADADPETGSTTLVRRIRSGSGRPELEPLATRPAGWGSRSDLLVLGEAGELGRSLRALLAASRPVTGQTLAQPHDAADPPRALDLDELAGRAAAAGAGLAQVAQALQDTVQSDPPGLVAERLDALLPFGLRTPVAPSALAEDELLRVARAMLDELGRRQASGTAALAAADTSAGTAASERAAEAAANDLDRARHRHAAAAADSARLHQLQEAMTAVFGPGVPALPLVLSPPADDALVAALAAPSPADGAEVRPWLSRWASVRGAAARYVESATFRDALGRRSSLRVAQLPADGFPSWVGLPFPEGVEPPTGPITSLVIETSAGSAVDGREALAGFVVDEWVDVVPRRIAVRDRENPEGPRNVVALTTTGTAVNAHAPSARPPQAILLAVTPDNQPWTVESLVGVIEDTFQLARERAVTLERVPLAPRIVPALYVKDWSLQGEPVFDVSAFLDRVDPAAAMTFVKG